MNLSLANSAQRPAKGQRLVTELRRKNESPSSPNKPSGDAPTFAWIEPTKLLIDDRYQRALSQRSKKLIEQIVAQWDWCRFKPPVVAETEAGLEIIDGQHTAIAAATHPEIREIPIMLIRSETVGSRAAAFIGHNRDRIAVTPIQYHSAAVVAGDPDATKVASVCAEAGVNILRCPPGGTGYRPGDTLAIGAVRDLVAHRTHVEAVLILSILTGAGCTPVTACGIKAVDYLLFSSEFRGKCTPDNITEALVDLAERAHAEAKLFAKTHNIPTWRGLAAVLFRFRHRISRRSEVL